MRCSLYFACLAALLAVASAASCPSIGIGAGDVVRLSFIFYFFSAALLRLTSAHVCAPARRRHARALLSSAAPVLLRGTPHRRMAMA